MRAHSAAQAGFNGVITARATANGPAKSLTDLLKLTFVKDGSAHSTVEVISIEPKVVDDSVFAKP